MLGLGVLPDAQAEIVVAVTPPVAIRGGDLVVPLASTDPSDEWPEVVVATIDGREVRAPVAWLVPRPLEEPRWTSPQTPVSIVPAIEGPAANGTALAVIRVPEAGDGPIDLLGSTWTPARLDAGSPVAASLPEATSLGPDADPPLDDPMEWFRWAVRADLEEARPPSPVGLSPIARRVAIAVAAEWRAGLERVRSASPGAASELASRLVATVVDETRPLGERLVAAWPTEPRSLASLRGILLDPDRTPIEAARAGLAWLDARPPFLAWVLEPGGDRVVLELANPTDGELVVVTAWTDAGQEQAIVLPARSLTRHEVERPRFQSGPMPATEELVLACEGHARRLLLGSRAIPVRPPGGSFGTLGFGRSLAAMASEFVEAPPAEAATIAVLRRRDARWEVFVESRSAGMPADDDRITLQFGPSGRVVAVLEVRADGGRRVTRGRDDGSLEVRTHRVDGRWRAVVVVPERWLVDAIGGSRGGVVLIGLRRTGPGDLVTFAGPPPPAWRREMSVQAFALADWGDPGAPKGLDSATRTDASSTAP